MEFVTFEIAKKLKEKCFKEQCLAYYSTDSDFYYNAGCGCDVQDVFKSFNSHPNLICGKRIDAPTISQVLKWLREEKKIAINAEFIPYVWQYKIFDMSFEERFEPCGKTFYEEYEQAALAGIEHVLDNLI